jgi:hypothetical protein
MKWKIKRKNQNFSLCRGFLSAKDRLYREPGQTGPRQTFFLKKKKILCREPVLGKHFSFFVKKKFVESLARLALGKEFFSKKKENALPRASQMGSRQRKQAR